MALHEESPLSFADIIGIGLRRCGQGEKTAVVASDLSYSCIEADVERHLIAIGIRVILHDVLRDERESVGRVEDDSEAGVLDGIPAGPSRPRILHAVNPPATKMLRFYAAADGYRKALADFTLSDWYVFASHAKNESAAWGKLAKAADIAIEALERTGKATVADLPKKDQQKLEEALP